MDTILSLMSTYPYTHRLLYRSTFIQEPLCAGDGNEQRPTTDGYVENKRLLSALNGVCISYFLLPRLKDYHEGEGRKILIPKD